MKLVIDEYKDSRAAIAGLFQFNPDEKFTQTVLSVTETELLFYNDNQPDIKDGDTYKYSVKRRYSLDNYPFVVDEKIVRNRDLANMGRLNFSSENEDDCFEFYYFLNDKRSVKAFLKELKDSGIKIKTRTVDLSVK